MKGSKLKIESRKYCNYNIQYKIELEILIEVQNTILKSID